MKHCIIISHLTPYIYPVIGTDDYKGYTFDVLLDEIAKVFYYYILSFKTNILNTITRMD